MQGVDESAAMLDIARAKVPGARFVLGDLRSLPVPSQSVDVVVCSLALTHLPDLDQPLAEAAWLKMVTPSGRAIRLPARGVHHSVLC